MTGTPLTSLDASPDMALRDCVPGTPLHALLAKAIAKGAWQAYTGSHKHGDPATRHWDRLRVGHTLLNGDILTIGARDMMRSLALTPPVAMTDPGQRLLYALRAEMGNLNAMAQATIDGETTWWYIEYAHAAEYLMAERRDAADDYPERHITSDARA